MSCGCGGLPPSVTLRIEAARIAIAGCGSNAAPARFTELAAAVHAFLIEGTDAKALDAKAKTSGPSVTERNAFVNGPLATMRMLREATIDKLETAGIMQPGAIVQWSADQVIEHAGLSEHEMEILTAELAGRGLRFGMTTDQVRTWIKGQDDGAQATEGE